MGTRNTELRNKEHGIQELGTRNSEHRNSEHGLTTYEVGAAFGSGNQSQEAQIRTIYYWYFYHSQRATT